MAGSETRRPASGDIPFGRPAPHAQGPAQGQPAPQQRQAKPAEEKPLPRRTVVTALITRRMQSLVQTLLGKGSDFDRFARVFLTALENADLLHCTDGSICRAMLHAAEVGLMPGGAYPHAYLIPYEDKKRNVTEAQFQISVWGFTELVRRAGVRKVWADVIYEGDKYECISGTAGKSIVHEPQWFARREDRGELCGAYACALLENGETVFEPVSAEELTLARHQNRGKSPAWDTWPEQQYQKVAIKRLSKYLPKGDRQTDRALAIDENPNTRAVIDVPGIEMPGDAPDAQGFNPQSASTPQSALDQAVQQAQAQAQNGNGERLTIDRERLFQMLGDADERWLKLRARVDGWDEMQALAAMAYLSAIARDISASGEPPEMPAHLRLDRQAGEEG